MPYLNDLVSKDNEQKEPQDKTRVFVVHGRNEELRKSMFEFLRSIGLKPIEWSQAIQMTGNASPFIGDILDAAFQQAQAVVVLLNGDDEARLRLEYHSDKMPDYEKKLTLQARPNVIFEAGLALGRFPTRTVIIEIGDLRPFSDIAGRHTIRLDNSAQRRQEIAQRLSTAGCHIDLSGTDWIHSGNFDATQITSIKGSVSKPTDENSHKNKEESLTISRNSRLSQEAINILVTMTNFPRGSHGGVYPYVLANSININHVRIEHYLKDLAKRGLVELISENPRFEYGEYDLTEKGKKLLVQRKLI